MPLFLLILFGFLVGACGAVAICAVIAALPSALAERRLARRLEDVSSIGPEEIDGAGESLVMRVVDGPLPALDRLVARTITGANLAKMIEQSGVRTTPSAIVLASFVLGFTAAVVGRVFIPFWAGAVVLGLGAAWAPTAF